MFKEALKAAMKFTLPIVTSVRNRRGECGSGIATCVVINDEGWIVTAAHIIKGFNEMGEAEKSARAKEQFWASASRQERRANKKREPSADDIDKWSVWFGGQDTAQIDPATVTVLEPCDLAVAKLLNFNKSNVLAYPAFKDPTKDYDTGASLCRLGFPFYDVGPSFDVASSCFRLANLPVPAFPNEGIMSRMQEIVLLDPTGNQIPPPPFPLRMIETSSPGIKGQSGGPIFDQKGAIWAIQSSTSHYAMDFSTKVEQYYHVGVGISSATVLGLFQQLNIKFEMSAH